MDKAGQASLVDYRNWLLGLVMGALVMLLLIILLAKGIIPIDLPFLCP